MTTSSTGEQLDEAQIADDRRYHLARTALSEAFTAARLVQYAPNSPQMDRLAEAEVSCQENPHPKTMPSAGERAAVED